MTLVNVQCRLAARPTGLPKKSDWSLVEESAHDRPPTRRRKRTSAKSPSHLGK